MNIVRSMILVFSATFVAWPAFADVKEVSQSDLRDAVATSRALPFASLLDDVTDRMGGKLIEVRAFEDERIYYRVLVIDRNGRVFSAVLDATNGNFISINSQQAQAVQLVARSTQSSGSGLEGLNATSDELPDASQSGTTTASENITNGAGNANDNAGSAGSDNSGAGAGGGQGNRP